MSGSFRHRSRGGLLAALITVGVLFPAASADAWWGGYGPGRWDCDPQWAYLEEYGFLDPWGPSRSDWQRLNQDQWRAMRYGYYGGGYYDPVTRAMRRQCGRWAARQPYYW
jgi:hypothetical protein